MAAGRVDVLRRRDTSHGYSKKGSHYCRNGGLYEKCSGGHHHRNGNHFPSNGLNSGFFQKNGYNLGSRRELDRTQVIRDDDTHKPDDGAQPPSAKKRKFSPIVWDVEDKDVKVTTRNKVTSETTTLSYASPPKSFAEAHCNVSDVVITESLDSFQDEREELLPKSQLSDSSTALSYSLSHGREHDDVREKLELQTGEFVQLRNISTSRWASDSDGEEEFYKKSSPESGEFIREHLKGDSCMQVRSDERSCPRSASEDESTENEFGRDDGMDADKSVGEGAFVDQLESDSDEPTERSMDMLQGCKNVDEYEKLNKINEGTYGVVYKARDKKTGEFVALKKLKDLDRASLEEYGFPVTSLREINILASFCHPSIVNVKEVVTGNHDTVFMVMEYVEHDLKGLLETMKQPFSTSEVKCLLLQLLEGVKYLHDHWVLHRDLKTSNLLMNNKGELKICDFGMARQYGSPLKPYTTKVVTQWYRAPELLLGAKKYSTAVDMWSVGCIMAELLAKEPLFKGTNEIDQLRKIFDTLGAPNEKIWPGFAKLPGAKACVSRQPYNLLRKKFPVASFTGSPVLSDLGFDLLNRLLTYDPDKRITAEEAINHDWFHEVPLPKSREFMPTFPPKLAQNRHLWK